MAIQQQHYIETSVIRGLANRCDERQNKERKSEPYLELCK